MAAPAWAFWSGIFAQNRYLHGGDRPRQRPASECWRARSVLLFTPTVQGKTPGKDPWPARMS
jgi:hypothetical protein